MNELVKCVGLILLAVIVLVLYFAMLGAFFAVPLKVIGMILTW